MILVLVNNLVFTLIVGVAGRSLQGKVIKSEAKLRAVATIGQLDLDAMILSQQKGA